MKKSPMLKGGIDREQVVNAFSAKLNWPTCSGKKQKKCKVRVVLGLRRKKRQYNIIEGINVWLIYGKVEKVQVDMV